MPLLAAAAAAAAATHGSRPHGEHATCDLLQALPNRHATTSDCGFSAAVQPRWWWFFSFFFFFFLTWHLFSRGEAGQAESTFRVRVREGLRDPYRLPPSNFHPTRLLPYLTDTVL